MTPASSVDSPRPVESSVAMFGRFRYVACAVACPPGPHAESLCQARGMLTAEEWLNADRILSPTRRAEHIIGRALARRLLGLALDMKPREVPIDSAPESKPRLRGAFPVTDFSVSHSGGHVVVGLTAHGRIGVDVENCRGESESVARRAFRQDELESIVERDRDHLTASFLGRWTTREARLKAMGMGLSFWGRAVDQEPTRADESWCDVFPLAPSVVAAVAFEPMHGDNAPKERVMAKLSVGWGLDG